MTKLVVINYNIGNIGSIMNMLSRVGVSAQHSSNIADIENADKIILPGVGAFDAGMQELKKSGLLPTLEKKILQDKTPILGICLGMQLFFDRSEEGCENGLGWLKGNVVKFSLPPEKKIKIPHMGWNAANPTCENALFHALNDDARFYFAHAFHVECEHAENILSQTHYGYAFASAIQSNNIYGVQFHPEKSHRYGMQLLKNFVERA